MYVMMGDEYDDYETNDDGDRDDDDNDDSACYLHATSTVSWQTRNDPNINNYGADLEENQLT